MARPSPASRRPLPTRPTVAVVGATGLVGRTLLRVLEERRLPVGELLPLASAGARHVRFAGRDHAVEPAAADAFDGVDLAFFAAGAETSRRLVPEALRRGARVVDKSSAFRGDFRGERGAALVVPEVNGAELEGDPALVVSPNCTTIGLVLVLEPLRRAAGLARVELTTFQSASGVGQEGLAALEREQADEGRSASARASPFAARLHQNVVPLCDALAPDGATAEERKLLAESRRILGDPGLELGATCVRVPVPIGHAAAVRVWTRRALSPAEACAALERFPGVRLVELATPREAAGGDEVLVARVRRPLAGPGLALWFAVDNLRKGAATNSVQIAEGMLARARSAARGAPPGPAPSGGPPSRTGYGV